MNPHIAMNLGDLASYHHDVLERYQKEDVIFRLWAQDQSLFKGDDIKLGWLFEPREIFAQVDSLKSMLSLAHKYEAIVLLGMGGSSLAAQVFKDILSHKHKSFFILDNIHPEAILALENNINILNTLFIVASKSGKTFESHELAAYFQAKLKKILFNDDDVASRFIAITDPHSPLAQDQGYALCIHGHSDIGGRFSAFSVFGIVPALLMGIDVESMLKSVHHMMLACGPSIIVKDNPSAQIGALLASIYLSGQHQVYIKLPSSLASLGLWLEQLIAESLGKDGISLLPIIIDNDHKMTKKIHFNIDFKNSNTINKHDNYINLILENKLEVVNLMYCFKHAIALAGYIMKINPFDQPDVEASKHCTQSILAKTHNNFADNNIYIPDKLKDFLSKINSQDYLAILSYLHDDDHNLLLKLKYLFSGKPDVIIQIGPRYLHSTGQAFKGGYNNGHFLVITGAYRHNLCNHQNIAFAKLHLSQALGDVMALKAKHRHVMHINITHQDDLKDILATIAMMKCR